MASAPLLEPRPRRHAAAIVAVLLALGAAGCGGSEVEYQEVPGDPAEITLPDRMPASTDAEADEDAATEEATPEAAATSDPATGATTDGTAESDSATAETTPAPAEDGATNDEPPVPGSDAERFEDFCEQNAGAC